MVKRRKTANISNNSSANDRKHVGRKYNEPSQLRSFKSRKTGRERATKVGLNECGALVLYKGGDEAETGDTRDPRSENRTSA